jgi:hypothetical protein
MYYILYFFLDYLAPHVSGAICTHHQEHNCSLQPYVFVWIGVFIPLEQVLVWDSFTL